MDMRHILGPGVGSIVRKSALHQQCNNRDMVMVDYQDLQDTTQSIHPCL